jgi:hypothetical protein
MSRPTPTSTLHSPLDVALGQQPRQSLAHGSRRNLHCCSKLRDTQRPALPQQIEQRNIGRFDFSLHDNVSSTTVMIAV